MMPSSDLPNPRAVLGAVKVRPGNGRASYEVSTTADLDRPCARRDRRCAGRDEGTVLGTNKGTERDREHPMT
jgi:hypothetical protein